MTANKGGNALSAVTSRSTQPGAGGFPLHGNPQKLSMSRRVFASHMCHVYHMHTVYRNKNTTAGSMSEPPVKKSTVTLLDFGFGAPQQPQAKRPRQTSESESDSEIEPPTESTAQSAGDTSRECVAVCVATNVDTALESAAKAASGSGVNSDLGTLSVEQIQKLPDCDNAG